MFKHILIICMFAFSQFCFGAIKEAPIKVLPSDFISTHLNASFAKNPYLDKKLGWGLHFEAMESKGNVSQVKAVGSYFDVSETKEIEGSIKAASIIFDGLVQKYNLKNKIEFTSEIVKVQTQKL